MLYMFVFFKQKTAYEMRISDWSSDVCSSDLDFNGYDTDGQIGQHHPQHRIQIRYKHTLDQLLAGQCRLVLEYDLHGAGRRHADLLVIQGRGKRQSLETRQGMIGMRSNSQTVCSVGPGDQALEVDRKSTRLNSSH